MNLQFGWQGFKEFMMLVIGVGIVILLINVRDTQEKDLTLGIGNRVAACLTAKGLQQDLNQPDGPCSDPNVRRQVDMITVTVIGSIDDHKNTQALICDLAKDNGWNVPSKCKELLGGG